MFSDLYTFIGVMSLDFCMCFPVPHFSVKWIKEEFELKVIIAQLADLLSNLDYIGALSSILINQCKLWYEKVSKRKKDDPNIKYPAAVTLPPLIILSQLPRSLIL